MNYIDKLLQGQEVEWRTLGDVVLATSNIRWRDTNKSYRYIDLTSVSREQNIILETTEITKDNAPSRAQKLVLKDDVIFATTRPTQQRLCLITDEYSNEVASTGYCVLRANTSVILPKWIFYWIASNEFKIFVEENQSGSAYPAISDAKVKEFQIPIPFPNDPQKSLAIQQEIVRVLDSLSEQNKALTTALAEEIENRKKQYAYYREELFRFEGKEVEWKTLGEVASIGTGSHDTKDAVEDGIYTFYARGVNPLKLNSYDFDETAIITAGDGVGVGKVFHWVEGKYALHQRAYKIVPIYDINARYIYYYIVTNFLGYVEKQSVHSSVTSLRKPMFIKFPIAIPSTQEQERIVRLLDQYDEAAKSIVAAIKKEIELRNKQFEYYRNLLLTFPKLKEVY